MAQNQLIYVSLLDSEKQLFIEIDESDKIRIVKKKILTAFGFQPSQIKKIHLLFIDIYRNQPADVQIPVFNEIDFKFIINFLVKQERPVKLRAYVVEGQQLAKKKQLQPEQEQELIFDENGSVIEREDAFNDNIPRSDLKYRGQQIVRCGFCNKSNKDKATLKICGGIYGPFIKNKFTHLNCALWCMQVFIDDNNCLMEQMQPNRKQVINKVIKQSQQKICFYCKKKGAGLKCNNKKCNRKFHYGCSYANQCRMNWKNFMVLCHICKQNESLCYQYLIKPKQYIDDRLIQPECGSNKADSYSVMFKQQQY